MTTLDADGKPVRTLTSTELGLAVLKRAGIELTADRIGSKRPCVTCARVFVVKAKNARYCEACKRGRCVDCDIPLLTHRCKQKNSRCRPCDQKARAAATADRSPRVPCPSCGTELYDSHKARTRKRCLTCTPKVVSNVCSDCARTIVGFPRRGRCFACYCRMRTNEKYPACVDCGSVAGDRSHRGLCRPCADIRVARHNAMQAARVQPPAV